VISEHDVREADVVHAIDHPAPRIERRQQRGRDEIAGEHHEHDVRSGRRAKMSHEVLQTRQVLQ